MKIRIDSLGPEGRSLDQTLPPQKVAAELEEARTGFVVRDTLRLVGAVRLERQTITITGHLKGLLLGLCRRCLAPTPLELDRGFELMLRPSAAARTPGRAGQDREELGEGEADGSFRLDEADEDVYHGDALELWPLLREQLLLALPDTQLCDEGCKGLCQVCGGNLNEEACGCERVIPDPRLAGLKDIKLS